MNAMLNQQAAQIKEIASQRGKLPSRRQVRRLKAQTRKFADDLKRLHMFSTSRKMNKFQVALCRPKTSVWSKPISLQSSEGVVCLVERHIQAVDPLPPPEVLVVHTQISNVQ
jgi:hypothetical protein